MWDEAAAHAQAPRCEEVWGSEGGILRGMKLLRMLKNPGVCVGTCGLWGCSSVGVYSFWCALRIPL